MKNAEYLDKVTDYESALVPETQGEGERMKQLVKRKLPVRRRIKRAAVLAAAVITVFGLACGAYAGSFDVKFAKLLDLSYVMESLDGGYMQIGQSCTNGDITAAASKSIGDKYSQWIEIDTDLPWTAEDEQYYAFEDMSFYVWKAPVTVNVKDGVFTGPFSGWARPLSGGNTVWAFENEGMVSFMIYAVDYEGINDAIILLNAENIVLYDSDSGIAEKHECSFSLSWRNCYEENARKGDTGTVTADEARCRIDRIEVTPVSVSVSGKVDKEDFIDLEIDEIILKDGSRAEGLSVYAAGMTGFGKAEWYYSLAECTINGDDIRAVVIAGKTFNIY